jgi:Domain of unknown function (DUF4124)
MTYLLTLALLLITSEAALCGELFKWTDENGKTHYSDRKPKLNGTETTNVIYLPAQKEFRDEKSIAKVITNNFNTVMSTKISALMDQAPNLKQLSVEIDISPEGNVLKTNVLNSELSGAELEKELMRAFDSLKFGSQAVKTTKYVWSIRFYSFGKKAREKSTKKIVNL